MTSRPAFFWLPNFITLVRLLSVPGLVYFILAEQMAAAFWVFVFAGVSDALDGLIAKRWNLVTTLGTYLDPLADKILLVSAFVTLGLLGHLPLWLVVLVVARDLLIVAGVLYYHQVARNLQMRPLVISKLNTLVQIVLIAIVLAQPGLGVALPEAVDTLVIWLTGATTVASGVGYFAARNRSSVESKV